MVVQFDANIASSLNKIIHNANFKKRINLAVQKAQLDDRFLHRRQIALLIYSYLRVTRAHEAVPNYSDPFRITSRGDNIQESDTRWDEVVLSIRKVLPDDIPENV